MTLREAAQALLDALKPITFRQTAEDRAEALGITWENFRPVPDAINALRAAISAPPDPGWEEGRDAAEAMRATLSGIAGGVYEEANTLRAWARDTLAAVSRLPVPSAPTQAARGTFPGDLDRMPSGHTRHCEARMEYGDGSCECGAPDDRTCRTCRIQPYCPSNRTTGERIVGMRGDCKDYVGNSTKPDPPAPEAKTAESAPNKYGITPMDCDNCGARYATALDGYSQRASDAAARLDEVTRWDLVFREKTILGLGDPIHLKLEAPPSRTLGAFDEATGTIYVDPAQPKVGQIVILLHEALHLVDATMVQVGITKRRANHGWITQAACNLAVLLGMLGLWRGIEPEEAKAFADNLDSPVAPEDTP